MKIAVIGLLESVGDALVETQDEIQPKIARCEDCYLPYQNFGMDVTIPDHQWTELTGYTEGEGLLCGCCIIQRGIRNEKYGIARLRFE